jgi:hypothetical protein
VAAGGGGPSATSDDAIVRPPREQGSQGSDRTFKGAVVLVDYPDQDFVVTQPPHSTVFGNPVRRPAVSRGRNEYWMDVPMPGRSFEYGMEFQSNACPAGANCQRDLHTDGSAAWTADVGDATKDFDFVFYLSAGQDESSTWQEFGEMKFGHPVRALDIVEIGRLDLAERSEWFLHPGRKLRTGRLRARVQPHSRHWRQLQQPVRRWMIPATQGGSMGAQHMLRNKLKLNIVDPAEVLSLDSARLAATGPVSARITARSAPTQPGALSGITIALNCGDKSPRCDRATDPLCDGGGYNNYTVEFTDQANRPRFLVSDVARDRAGPQARGVAMWQSALAFAFGGLATCRFPVFNTGKANGAVVPYDTDSYRLGAATTSPGWQVRLPNELATARSGGQEPVTVYARRGPGGSPFGTVSLTATSAADPAKTATATCTTFGS